MKKIRYIEKFDMLNTFGKVAVSVWFQGCVHHCKGCFNAHTWKETDEKMTSDEVREITRAIQGDGITKDISYLGGDPFIESNRKDFFSLLMYVSKVSPKSKQYAWTGYNFEEIKHLPHLEYLDVIVEGKFIEELKVTGKKYGSSNQRVWIKEKNTWKVTDKY